MAGLISNTMNKTNYNNTTLTGRAGGDFQTDAEGWRLNADGTRSDMRIGSDGLAYRGGDQFGYVQDNSVVSGTPTKVDEYDATTRDVDAPTETVAGQMDALLKSGSPYIERAKAGAAQTANARGLLNSSMAAGAGEAAAIDAALPIASADAAAYGTAARENQGYTNTAGQFNAAARNTSNLQTQATTAQKGIIETQATAQSRLQKEASDQKIAQLVQAGQIDQALQEVKGQQATELASIEAQYKQLMQSSASAATVFQQVSKNINDILNDPNTSVEQKQAAVSNQTAMLQSSMSVIGATANVDLAGLLDFSTLAEPVAGTKETNAELTAARARIADLEAQLEAGQVATPADD